MEEGHLSSFVQTPPQQFLNLGFPTAEASLCGDQRPSKHVLQRSHFCPASLIISIIVLTTLSLRNL